jgi:Cdc6-like AAA superfamily ATPase
MQSAQRRGSLKDFELFMFNAMTFMNGKSFALSLLQDITEKKTGLDTARLSKQSVDEEEVSELVAKALSYGNDRTCAFKKWKHIKPKHNIIVIDEVDQFNACEKGLTLLVKAILNNEQFSHTNTSIVGIANSVDLPFKKKHSAIAMRDCQLLFKPYSTEDIVDIL